MRVDEADDPGSGLDYTEPERLGHGPSDGRFGRRRVEVDLAAEAQRLVVQAEHEVGVGDRGVGPTLAVARRPRIRAGRRRSDGQPAEVVDTGDAAAAGADRVDVDRRVGRGVAADIEVDPGIGHAVEDSGHVGARATHVEGEQIGRVDQPAQLGGGDRPAGRPGQQRQDRQSAGPLGPDQPAGGLHHLQLVGTGAGCARRGAADRGSRASAA